MRLMEIGAVCSGRVVDEDRWDASCLPPYAKPKRYESGKVIGVNTGFPEVVTILTPRGETVVIRRG